MQQADGSWTSCLGLRSFPIVITEARNAVDRSRFFFLEIDGRGSAAPCLLLCYFGAEPIWAKPLFGTHPSNRRFSVLSPRERPSEGSRRDVTAFGWPGFVMRS